MNSIISVVISGGQTGVDVAALRAAQALGLPTGGTMPRGWRTLDGPRPEYRGLYRMTEHASSSYVPRTYANVSDSDITIRIARNFSSTGERCTISALRRYSRPSIDMWLTANWAPCFRWGATEKPGSIDLSCIDVYNDVMPQVVKCIFAVSQSLGRPIVVNFAGNSERTAPGIEKAAEEIVREILERAMGHTGG